MVYPAAGLIDFVAEEVVRYVVDLEIPYIAGADLVKKIPLKATVGVPMMVDELLAAVQ